MYTLNNVTFAIQGCVLQVGDEIRKLNGFTVSQAIHEEVLNLIRSRSELDLKIRSEYIIKFIILQRFVVSHLHIDQQTRYMDRMLD